MNFDEVFAEYQRTYSIRRTAQKFKISESKTRKILITCGVNIHSVEADRIMSLHKQGLSQQEIIEVTGFPKKKVNQFLPYDSGPHQRWTDEEIQLLLSGVNVPGRTKKACKGKLYKLLRLNK